eukprot:15479152-Alexandrium_andersonii.AAC.1
MGLGIEQQQLSVGWALPDRMPACQCSARARFCASRYGLYGRPVPLEHPCGRSWCVAAAWLQERIAHQRPSGCLSW